MLRTCAQSLGYDLPEARETTTTTRVSGADLYSAVCGGLSGDVGVQFDSLQVAAVEGGGEDIYDLFLRGRVTNRASDAVQVSALVADVVLANEQVALGPLLITLVDEPGNPVHELRPGQTAFIEHERGLFVVQTAASRPGSRTPRAAELNASRSIVGWSDLLAAACPPPVLTTR